MQEGWRSMQVHGAIWTRDDAHQLELHWIWPWTIGCTRSTGEDRMGKELFMGVSRKRHGFGLCMGLCWEQVVVQGGTGAGD